MFLPQKKIKMQEFIENNINKYAEAIIKGSDKRDAFCLGQLTFFMALRRITKGEATREGLGMADAINDTLQEAGLIDKDKTFVSLLKK